MIIYFLEKNLTNFLNTCDWLNDEKKPADILVSNIKNKNF